MIRHLPNFITLLNLASGTLAIALCLEGQWRGAILLLGLAVLFDFLDGLAARMLHAQSETGKQLDSLADMVSFGLLPAFMLYRIFQDHYQLAELPGGVLTERFIQISLVIIPLCSAIRLARFNLDQGPKTFFSGLPTPAHALFWAGISWQLMDQGSFYGQELHPFILWAIMGIMALHMILPLPMYSLKFTHFRLRGNLVRYAMILLAIGILGLTGIPGLSLLILSYILLSLLNFLLQMRVSP